jgi:hypothetical protein
LVVPFKASALSTVPGPFVSILFSRTEITAAHSCHPDSTNIARLDTQVAPYLKSLHMIGTGTLATALVRQSKETCEHLNSSMLGSWDDATHLSTTYGWRFVSHTATFPIGNLDHLKSAQANAETCGSANTIAAHGLHGAHGLIAYPGAAGAPKILHAEYGSKCFAWGRRYCCGGLTPKSFGTTPPYWQHTHAGDGGGCNVKTAPCYKVVNISDPSRYTLPSELIGYVHSLAPGKWFTYQSFILVKGYRRATAAGKGAWDCTSANPALHWSNDNERYCYTDFQAVIRAIAASGAKVTDPLTVGIAFGRPAHYPRSVP